ncbi:hypothetical protein PM082_023050 [Marasmius tenuissimus]|nr:hypothetical protein PM082_023050 [Marasmius tenuissimus]
MDQRFDTRKNKDEPYSETPRYLYKVSSSTLEPHTADSSLQEYKNNSQTLACSFAFSRSRLCWFRSICGLAYLRAKVYLAVTVVDSTGGWGHVMIQSWSTGLEVSMLFVNTCCKLYL